MNFSKDGRRLLVGGWRDALWAAASVLNLDTGTVSPLPITRIKAAGVSNPETDMHYSMAAIAYAVWSWGQSQAPSDSHTGGVAVVLPATIPNNAELRFSPDGKLVATPGRRELRIYSVTDGTPIPLPNLYFADECCFSPDSRRVAYADRSGGRIHHLRLDAGKLAVPFESPESRPTSLEFSPDGRILATGCDDGSVLLWDMDKPRPLTYEFDSEQAAREVTGSNVWRGEPPDPTLARRIRATVNPDKEAYVFGEEVFLTFELRNRARWPYRFEVGGDYRGATRHTSYHVEAVHEDGIPAADPHPHQLCMGGLVHEKMLMRDDVWRDGVPLLAFRRIDRPGRYRVPVSRGGHVAETSLEIRRPTADEARRHVEEMDDRFDKTRREHPNAVPAVGYATMTHPAYFDLLVARAKAGNIHVLTALGGMPDPAATKALIELLDHPYPVFVEAVEDQLFMRLPDPDLDDRVRPRRFLHDDAIEPRQYLRDTSWRPEFAAAVRAHAKRCLGLGDDTNLYRGAFFLACVGTADDLPVLLAGFDGALAAFQNRSLADRSGFYRLIACPEMRQAVQLMIRRGAAVPAAPKSGAEKILFAEAIACRPDFRPRDWDATLADILRDRLDYVRQVGVACIPMPPPDRVAAVLPVLFNDRDPLVRQAALELAGQVAVPALKPAVVGAMVAARTEKEFWQANEAAKKYCTSFEMAELYADKILDAETAKVGLQALTKIFHDTSGTYAGQSLAVPKVRHSCHAAWRRLIDSQREQLKSERPFSVLDPIPKNELFPGFDFLTPLEHETKRRESAEFQNLMERE